MDQPLVADTHRPRRSSGRLASRLAAGLVIAGLVGVTQPGCSRQGWQLAGALIELTAGVANLVAAVAVADHAAAHFHGGGCGHRWVWYDGRHVFEADGQWEYYDEDEGAWYVYPDGIPGYD